MSDGGGYIWECWRYILKLLVPILKVNVYSIFGFAEFIEVRQVKARQSQWLENKSCQYIIQLLLVYS